METVGVDHTARGAGEAAGRLFVEKCNKKRPND